MAYSMGLLPTMNLVDRSSTRPFELSRKRKRATVAPVSSPSIPVAETAIWARRSHLLGSAAHPIEVADNGSVIAYDHDTPGLLSFPTVTSEPLPAAIDEIRAAPGLSAALQEQYFSIFRAKIRAGIQIFQPYPSFLNVGEHKMKRDTWTKISFDCTPALFNTLFPESSSCQQLQPRSDFRSRSAVMIRVLTVAAAQQLFQHEFLRTWTANENSLVDHNREYRAQLSSPIYLLLFNSARRHQLQIAFTHSVRDVSLLDGSERVFKQIRPRYLRACSNQPSYRRK